MYLKVSHLKDMKLQVSSEFILYYILRLGARVYSSPSFPRAIKHSNSAPSYLPDVFGFQIVYGANLRIASAS